MEDERAVVGPVVLHVIVEDMVAPERLAESVDKLTGEILLPVDPPEVDPLFLSCADDAVEHIVVELRVAEIPGHHLGALIESHVITQFGEEVLIIVYTVGGVQVEGHLESVVVHPLDESFGVGYGRAVPGPSRPSLCMPVHIEDHDIHGDIVLLHVVDDFHELIGSIALVLAVPITEHIEWRHGLTSGHLNEIAQCFFVLVTITEEIPVDRLFINGLCHPVDSVALLVEGERGGAVAPLGERRLIDDTPSCSGEETILQFLPFVVANLSVECSGGTFQVERVVLARIPEHGSAIE